jgi:hypothetical protein
MERSPEHPDTARDDDAPEHEAEAARRDPHERDESDGGEAGNPAPPGNVQTGTNTGS